MKLKNILVLLIIFTFLNGLVFYVTKLSSEEKIKNILQQSSEKLNIHYDILIETQRVIASSIYQDTIANPQIIDILSKAQKSSTSQRDVLRKQLHKLVTHKYKIIKEEGVLQFQFIFPDNISFYRAHKPSKYGDDLSGIREDFEYVNRTTKPIRGFTQGRTAHGFRNTFPVFDKNGKHIATLEVSFGSDNLQRHLNNISKIHSHFLVDKHIFDAKAWERNDMVLKYTPSAEHKDFMITLNSLHTKQQCVIENKKRLEPISEKISDNIKKDKLFSLFFKDQERIVVAAFLPIKNISNKTVAWIVSYERFPIILSIQKSIWAIRALAFIFSVFVIYFLIRQQLYRKKIEENNQQLEELNKTLENRVKERTLELESLNHLLEDKVKKAVEENKKQQHKMYEQSKSAQMGEMIGNIAHQWRQPLSVISTAATGMKMQKEFNILKDEDFNKTCDSINQNAQFLSETINTFRDYIKEDKVKAEVILQDRINKAVKIIDASIKNKHIELINNINKVEPIKITMVIGELSQVIINLINNAKDALLKTQVENPFIKIDLYKENDMVKIVVEDNGGGIDEKVLPSIFDPYFTTKHQSVGTGLGLHMSKEIIEKHLHGKIYAENFENGVRFTIELPLDQP